MQDVKFYVAGCPLLSCNWGSDPVRSEDQAHEQRRAHISGHGHADLVAFTTDHSPLPVCFEPRSAVPV